jgi:hypothetical protein
LTVNVPPHRIKKKMGESVTRLFTVVTPLFLFILTF